MPELEMAEISLEELALEHAELLPARNTLQLIGPITVQAQVGGIAVGVLNQAPVVANPNFAPQTVFAPSG